MFGWPVFVLFTPWKLEDVPHLKSSLFETRRSPELLEISLKGLQKGVTVSGYLAILFRQLERGNI
jgi:hypothetical protein